MRIMPTAEDKESRLALVRGNSLLCLLIVVFAVVAFERASCGMQRATEPPSAVQEESVISAFSRMHDGWSADEVLLEDSKRMTFVEQCIAAGFEVADAPQATLPNTIEDACARALLHVRKAGGRLPKTTRRAKAVSPTVVPIAEIAARRLADELDCHTDAILVDTEARQMFDAFVQRLAPEVSAYEARKAALQLRKTRHLEPELVGRVTDWVRNIDDRRVAEFRTDLTLVPERPGVYIFHDASGYLYVGQAADLRERMKTHLSESDRKSLADYLASAEPESLRVELHVFAEGSPAEDLRIRRAYESELIRSRKPRLNLAP